VVIISDVDTCSSNSFLKALLEYISEHGDHRSAAEFSQATNAVDEPRNMPVVSLSGTVSEAISTAPAVPKGTTTSTKKSKTYIEKVAKRSMSLSEYKELLDRLLVDAVKSMREGSIVGGMVRIEAFSASMGRDSPIVTLTAGPGEAAVLEFPPTLNSFQRMSLHAYADELGLFHRSIGEGSVRILQVSLKELDLHKADDSEPQNAADDEVDVVRNEQADDADTMARIHPVSYTSDVKVAPTKPKNNVSRPALPPKPDYVADQKRTYVSAERLAASQQKLPDADDEEAMLDALISQNKV
jgi:hypothetical protein